MNPVSDRIRTALAAVVLFVAVGHARAQDAAEAVTSPIGRFITVTSPVNDVMTGRVTNSALELQNLAVQEKRPAILVLEITNGSSRFGQVSDLARFLTATRISRVRTVAWIPETVTGNNVILALACSEIVMHPDASLGDIGRGQPVDDVEQQFVLSLVNRKHNRMVSRALARKMMDPSVAIMQAEILDDSGEPDVVFTVLRQTAAIWRSRSRTPAWKIRRRKRAA